MKCGHGVSEAAKGAYATVTITAFDLYEDILPVVEATVDALSKFGRAVTHITYITISTTNLLNECELENPIDSDNTMTEGLEEAEDNLRGGVEILRKKRAAAETDGGLKGDNERRVISSYERAIVALEGLHDAVVDFRWAILEHDSNLEQPTGNQTESSDELLRFALG